MKIYKIIFFSIICLLLIGSFVKGEADLFDNQNEINHREFKSFQSREVEWNKRQLLRVVDSVLESKTLSSDVISFLNFKIDSLQNTHQNYFLDTNPYPAHHFYQSWNTMLSHSYSREIRKNDTVLNLKLTDKSWSCYYHHPHDGYITSRYGWRGDKMHNGIDIKIKTGDSIKNTFRGVVRLAKWQSGYGRTVIVRHYNGLETLYGHLSKLLVKPGDHVDPGDFIALGGNSGRSSGSHLHFETRFKGVALNPESFIDFQKKEIKNDSLILRKIRYGYAAYTPDVEFYTVKNGDYLYKIAMEYGLSMKKICRINGIRRNHYLTVGEKIRITD